MEYYSALIKKDNLPFVTKRVDLVYVISQRQELYDMTYMWHLKQDKVFKKESKMVITKDGVQGDGTDVVYYKFTTPNLQGIVNKPEVFNALYSEYKHKYCIIVIKLAKRLGINNCNH